MKSPSLGIAVATLSVMPLWAADLPKTVYTPPPPPLFSWTGFYGGVNAGAIISNSSNVRATGDFVVVRPLIAAGGIPAVYKSDDTGFIGGGQIGYNYQTGSFVWGFETDFQGTSMSKTTTIVGRNVTGAFKGSLDWLGTARGRIGYTVYDRFMLYFTGGLAYGDSHLDYSLVDTSGVFGGRTLSGSRSNTSVGWTLGGGGEWAFTPNWSVKAEYLYYDLGNNTVTASNVAVPVATSSVRREQTGSIVRAGLNYKFW